MAPEGATQVAGGNWQIFSNMMIASGANVQLNTSVTSIDLISNEDSPDKFTLKTTSTDSLSGEVAADPLAFDDVIVATPYQFSGIKASDDVLQRPIDVPILPLLYFNLVSQKLEISLNTSPSDSNHASTLSPKS